MRLIKESKTPNSDKNVKQNKSKLSLSSLTHFLEESLVVDLDEKNEEENPHSNSESKTSQKNAENSIKNPPNKTQIEEPSAHRNTEKDKNSDISRESEISFLGHYRDSDGLNSLKKNKKKIKKILAVSFSLLLIIVGIILISTSAVQISDNVIFGERAMFSAFLILIGFLILAVVFAGKLLQGTFLKKIQNELEVTEGKTRETKNDPVTGRDKGINKKD